MPFTIPPSLLLVPLKPLTTDMTKRRVYSFLLRAFVRYLPSNNSVEGVHLGDHLGRAQDAGRVPSVLLLHLHQLDDCYTLMA